RRAGGCSLPASEGTCRQGRDARVPPREQGGRRRRPDRASPRIPRVVGQKEAVETGMTFRVEIARRATREIEEQYEWLAERSPVAADRCWAGGRWNSGGVGV